MVITVDLVARKRDEIARLCRQGLDAQTLLDRVRAPLRAVVPFDGSFVSATDPSTTLFASAAVVERLPAWTCAPYFDNEFLAEDFNKFADLHRSGVTTSTLHRATFDRPARSARFTEINAAVGFGAELRSTASLAGACWGSINLLREAGRPDFDDREVAFVAEAGVDLAHGLRRAVLTARAAPMAEHRTGVVLLDGDGRVTSMTGTAAALLDELGHLPVPHGSGAALPAEAYIVCARARARAAGRPGGAASARVQARQGGWLTLRAECTLALDGSVEATALVIEPSRSEELLPLFVAAYDLSPREVEVLALLARGTATGRIATELLISVHTVRDHVKSIFEKAGVTSRGELLSALFHLHAQPRYGVVHDGG